MGGALWAPSKDLWETRRRVFHGSGTIHGPVRRAIADRHHALALGPRRVPGSRIVGPFSVSRCA